MTWSIPLARRRNLRRSAHWRYLHKLTSMLITSHINHLQNGAVCASRHAAELANIADNIRRRTSASYNLTTPSCTTLVYLHSVLADNKPTLFLQQWRQQKGLCTAVFTSKKSYTPHQAAQLHRWIVKHGFAKSILQSDAETSLMQLVNTMAADLNLPTRVSPPAATSTANLIRFLQGHFHEHFSTAHSS